MKLSASWQNLPGLTDLLTALGAAQGMVRYVGGCVRDGLLNLPIHDIDLATTWNPEDVMERVRAAGFSVIPTGLKHGTVTVLLPGKEPIEITTLRRDVESDGRHATVEFTKDWCQDAARRDFTINALTADPLTGEVYDYFDGIKDLAEGRVRFIGNAIDRIDEDRLRVLRFFRFHQRFGKAVPDEAAIEACKRRSDVLRLLSVERIAAETLKMLDLPQATATFELMNQHGILNSILPEATDTNALWVMERRDARMGLKPDPILRLAALINTAPAAGEVARRLKLSNADRQRIAAARAKLVFGIEENFPMLDRVAYKHGARAVLDNAMIAQNIGDIEMFEIIARYSDWARPEMLVRGQHLIEMGLTAGPVVGHIQKALEQQWVAEHFPGHERTVEIAKRLVANTLARA